ncbi:MAG: hypothetical protein CSB55_00870 [Candidatus Cloacimonadota bacterium]|nr:MAG: hypothetical protein CSB55_00870 [Candidatus Cloacimonadota bacterium]
MKLKFILLFMLFISLGFAFQPKDYNFISSETFSIYLSWEKNCRMKQTVPAFLSQNEIQSVYSSNNQDTVLVNFDLVNMKIATIREVLIYPENFGKAIPDDLIKKAEQFVFTANSDNELFVKNFLTAEGINLNFGGKKNVQAIKLLINSRKRIFPEFTDYKLLNNSVKLIMKLAEGEIFSLEIPVSKEISDQIKIKKNKLDFEFYLKNSVENFDDFLKQKTENINYEIPRLYFEDKVSSTHENLSEKTNKKTESIEDLKKEAADKTSTSIQKSEVYKFLIENKNKYRGRRLYQNEIENIFDFMVNSLPRHRVENKNNVYSAQTVSGPNEMSADISLIPDKDEVFKVSSDYEIKNNDIMLSSGICVKSESLTLPEQERIAPFLNRLIQEHRSLGSPVFDILAAPNVASASVLIKAGDERELIEMGSYSNLLFILHRYWKNKTVYFEIDKLRKVDGDIEISAHLIAWNTKQNLHDFGEIRFRLNSENKIDLAMMILYPDVKSR